MRPPIDAYLFGRVIDVNTNVIRGYSGILIYIYKIRSHDKSPVPKLDRDQLLIPPEITNKRPWTMGYFENIAHEQLNSSDRITHHCFKNVWGKYFDEAGNRLAEPTEPVGSWALSSFRTIDDAISNALGIPLSPDDES